MKFRRVGSGMMIFLEAPADLKSFVGDPRDSGAYIFHSCMGFENQI